MRRCLSANLCARRDDGLPTDLEPPLMIAPQPVRDASIVNVTQRHEAPNLGPWERNEGFFHMGKTQRQHRVTLIMWNVLPLKENLLVLSHYCSDLMYSRPRGITFDAAAIRPNCLNLLWWTSPQSWFAFEFQCQHLESERLNWAVVLAQIYDGMHPSWEQWSISCKSWTASRA